MRAYTRVRIIGSRQFAGQHMKCATYTFSQADSFDTFWSSICCVCEKREEGVCLHMLLLGYSVALRLARTSFFLRLG